MKSKARVFAGDFETRCSGADFIAKKTSVWLSDICELGTLKHVTDTSMEEFFNTVEQLGKSIIYFHNLSGFDGHFILSHLFKNGWILNKNKKLKSHTFKTLIDDRGQLYTITVCFDDGGKRHKNQKIAEFRDSMRKIHGKVEEIAHSYNLPIQKLHINYTKYRPLNYKPTKKEITYIQADTEIIARALDMQYALGMTHITSAGDSFNLYKEFCGNRFRSLYPVLPIEVDRFIRASYRGGVCQVKEEYQYKTIKGKINVYDVNSMYPYQMCTQLLPYGTPQYYNGKYKPDKVFPLYIQRIIVQCALKPNKQPTIIIQDQYISVVTRYLIDNTLSEPIELTLTSIDLELLFNHYDIYAIEYLDGYKFMGTYNLFHEFVLPLYKKKSTTKGAERQLNKILINSLYGKFGMNPEKVNRDPYLDPSTNIVEFDTIGEAVDTDPIYTAVASFITSYARKQLFSIIDANYSAFLYTDTDSIHLLNSSLPPELVSDTELGKWKLEKTYIKAKYLGQKAYYGWIPIIKNNRRSHKNDIKLAGCPDNVKEKIYFNSFEIGAEFNNKLTPMKVDGGVILVGTKFTIKKR